MSWAEIAGHLGAFLSSVTFIPQVWKAWQTKSVKDLSIYMIIIVFCSTIIWLIYGISFSLWPVVIANAVILVLSTMLLFFKFTFPK
tara:strand:- start:196 stop:453 length:258 start_codon:yes stop_codon:yes gene_type:complete